MATNRGKDFENVIRESFLQVPNTSVVRLADPVQGYLGIRNHCDFIVYHKPYEYHIECKSVHGNTLSIHSNDPKKKYGNITNNQWEGLLEKSEIDGIVAGVLVWWIDRDVTRFVPIKVLSEMRKHDKKSLRYDIDVYYGEMTYVIEGKKKRVFFDYDMNDFFKQSEKFQLGGRV